MKRVLLDLTEGLMRMALVEDGTLVELYLESKRNESLVDNVYVGRVEQVVPNLQACFVDIGAKRNAYYYYGEKRALADTEQNVKKPKVGDSLLVQVIKDEAGTKGAVLTTNLSFGGKFLVLMPNDSEIGISRKITEEEERERLRTLLKQTLPEGFGAIARTNAQGRTQAEFEKELQTLLPQLSLLQAWQYQKAPTCLMARNHPVEKAARDFYRTDIDSFWVNDAKAFALLSQTGDFNQEGQPKLCLHESAEPLFEAYFIESQARKALDARVWLKSGGYLVIEETEACVVIDVNSAKAAGRGNLERMIQKTNLEAAEEVAKQLRLRNLSGIIIVDFIDMATAEQRNLVQKTLEQAVAKDRIKTVVVGMTELGLMQLTRKKTRPSLKLQMTTNCRTCEGTGRLPSLEVSIMHMRQEVQSILYHTIYNHITISADKRLLEAFAGKEHTFLKQLRQQYDATLVLKEDAFLPFSAYFIEKEKK